MSGDTEHTKSALLLKHKITCWLWGWSSAVTFYLAGELVTVMTWAPGPVSLFSLLMFAVNGVIAIHSYRVAFKDTKVSVRLFDPQGKEIT